MRHLLTTWENQLRKAAGQSGYRGGFVAKLLHDAMFFDADLWVFTVAYSLFGVAVLATFFIAPPRRPVVRDRRHPSLRGQ